MKRLSPKTRHLFRTNKRETHIVDGKEKCYETRCGYFIKESNFADKSLPVCKKCKSL